MGEVTEGLSCAECGWTPVRPESLPRELSAEDGAGL